MKLRISLASLVLVAATTANAEDWPRFRGPAGSGVAMKDTLPAEWSANANLAWKTELPGPGASSPIIIGDKAFVTCYSGYGVDKDSVGEMEDLMRHLVCVDLKSGKKLWQADVKAALPEDPYDGAGIPAHGYASHTPVSDGTHVYAFFGKGGVHAFDLNGKKIWEAKVGMESDPRKWGSSSSPVVYKDTVIVVAAAESQSIIGFDKKSGKELWRQEAEGLDNTWGTPGLVKVNDTRTDLVMYVAKELWGLDPNSGKMRWLANAGESPQVYSSIVPNGSEVLAMTAQGTFAIEAGGSGDVSESKTSWKQDRVSTGYASPILHNGKVYSVNRNIVTTVDAKTGERLNQTRLKGVMPSTGRFGALDYPSPIVVGNRMLYLNSRGQMFVIALDGDAPKQVGVNRVTTQTEVFRGTPAVSDGHLVMRSMKYLYCVKDKSESVPEADKKLAMAKERPRPEGGQRSRGRRISMDERFAQMDKDKDGVLSTEEMGDDQVGQFLKRLDKDKDGKVTKKEMTDGVAAMQRRGYGGGEDSRPDRPQRPEMVDKE